MAATAEPTWILPWLDPNYVDPPKEYMSLAEFIDVYERKKRKFLSSSTKDHEHNSFSKDHSSTLSQFGYEVLGRNLMRYLETDKKKYTIIEIGTGTGIGTSGLVQNLNPSLVERYICTEPFNDICEFPDAPVPVVKSRMNLDETIEMISADDSIGPVILLVVCPPPLHELNWKLAEKLVSTDVMALFESVKCPKIENVIITRYNNSWRSQLDGTINFYQHYIEHFEHFGMWKHDVDATRKIEKYEGADEDFFRVMEVFARM